MLQTIYISNKCCSLKPKAYFKLSPVPVAQQSIALAAQKVVGSIPREQTYWQKMYSLNI